MRDEFRWLHGGAARELAQERHPSILGLWAKQGGEKFQRLISRLDDMERFKELFQSLNGLLPQAIFRAKLNPMAAEPLSMLPNKPEREFSNAQFQYYLCDRLQAMQPSVASISLLRCNCKEKCVLGDSNGRHPRKFSKGNSKTIFHDTMRDILIRMCTSAGLSVRSLKFLDGHYEVEQRFVYLRVLNVHLTIAVILSHLVIMFIIDRELFSQVI